MLVVTSNDGLAPSNDALVAAVRARGNTHVTAVHFDTDHSYSDRRIALESAVIRWLQSLPEAVRYSSVPRRIRNATLK